MMDHQYQSVLIAILCYTFLPQTQSAVGFYGCKTILVSGVTTYQALNGLYDKAFECTAYPVFRLQGKNAYLYYRIEEVRWVISDHMNVNDCSNLSGDIRVVGTGNKLYPHMIEPNWKERSGGNFRDNANIKVECDDIHWTMGCTMRNFPLMDSRCYNETSAIEVHDVYVVTFPKGKEKYCAISENLCNMIGQCDVREAECKQKVSHDDYDFKMAQINCDGRHIKCHSYMVEPLYHINCNLTANFPCDVQPDIRVAIMVEYKCRRSRKYLGSDSPVKKTIPPLPIQIIPSCQTTTKRSIDPRKKTAKDKKDTLIYYVAPPAGVVFFVIIIAVVVVTICRRRKKRNRPTIMSRIKRPIEERTYANIPPQGVGRVNRRRDFTDKRRKVNQTQSTKDERVAEAIAKAMVDINPELNTTNKHNSDEPFTVIVLDKKDMPNLYVDHDNVSMPTSIPSRTSASGTLSSVDTEEQMIRKDRLPNPPHERSVYGYSQSSKNNPGMDRRPSRALPHSENDVRKSRDNNQQKIDTPSIRAYQGHDPRGRLPLADSVIKSNIGYDNYSYTK